MSSQSRLPRRTFPEVDPAWLALPAGVVAGALVYGFAPVPADMAVMLAITVFCISLWVGSPVDPWFTGVVCLGLVGVAFSTDVALVGFRSPATWLVVFGILLGAATRQSGLARLVERRVVRLVPDRASTDATVAYRYLLATLSAAAFGLVILIPSSLVRVLVLGPMLVSVGERFTERRPRIGLFLGPLFVTYYAGTGILTGSLANIIITGLVESDAGVSIGWVEWARWLAPVMGLGRTAVIALVAYVLYRPRDPSAIESDDDVDGSPGARSTGPATGTESAETPMATGTESAETPMATETESAETATSTGTESAETATSSGTESVEAVTSSETETAESATSTGTASAETATATESDGTRAWTGERRMLAFLLVGVAVWATDVLHGLHPLYGALVVVLLAFAPRIGVAGSDALSEADFSIVFFLGAIFAIAEGLRATGFTDLAAESILASLPGGATLPVVLGFVVVAAMGLAVLMEGLAVASVLTPVLVSFSASAGVPLVPVVMTEAIALNTYFFPYQSAVLVAILGLDVVGSRELIRMATACSVATLVVLLPIQVAVFSLAF